jgi:hypothetical protein
MLVQLNLQELRHLNYLSDIYQKCKVPRCILAAIVAMRISVPLFIGEIHLLLIAVIALCGIYFVDAAFVTIITRVIAVKRRIQWRISRHRNIRLLKMGHMSEIYPSYERQQDYPISKNPILVCPPISGERVEKIKTNITQWLLTSSLYVLVERFGGRDRPARDVYELSEMFLWFSDVWDFRSSQGARWLLNSDELTEKQKQSALIAALDLGLMDKTIPAYESYDYIWVLGGARLSCLLRSQLAKQTTTPTKAVVMLSSPRPIDDSEREATDTYAPTAETEFDLFVAAAQKEFGVGDDFTEERHDDWIIRKYQEDPTLFVISAPSSEPEKRPSNSVDTYEFFFDHFKVEEGANILLVTSQIYAPYQHLEAMRTIAIPHRVNIDTIGLVPESVNQSEAAHYLQEIRSTIQAIDRFLNMKFD